MTTDVFAMVGTGAVVGLVLGLMATRYVATLLYQVKATDAVMLGIPVVVIVAAALLASLPAVLRAVRIDPVAMLRAE